MYAMSSSRVNLMFDLYILLKKMQHQTANLNHDLIFRNTIMYNLEDNPCTVDFLCKIYSCPADAINPILEDLEESGLVKNEEKMYSLTYTGQKEIEERKKLTVKHGTEGIAGLTENEIKTLIKLINKMVLEKQPDNEVVHDYFS